MTIIGLVGFLGSGKDTVADQLLAIHPGKKESFAAPLKDMTAAIFGWPRHLLEGDTIESRDFRDTPDIFWTRKTGIDNFTPRLALQLIGTNVLRKHWNENIWLDSLEYRLRQNTNPTEITIITDCRFQNELALIQKLNGKVIRVMRGDEPEWHQTAIEANRGNAVSQKIMQTRYRDVHESEWDWVGFDVDHIVHNNGTFEDLKEEVGNLASILVTPALKIV